MSRKSGNCQAPASQGTHSASVTPGSRACRTHFGLATLPPGCRRRLTAIPHECRVACDPTFSESHSLYPTTLGGENGANPARRPLPRPDRLRIIHADGPLSSSIILPPPSEACHSSALQVNSSSAALATQNPKLFPTFARSPACIRAAIICSSSMSRWLLDIHTVAKGRCDKNRKTDVGTICHKPTSLLSTV